MAVGISSDDDIPRGDSVLRLVPDLEGAGIDAERSYGCLPRLFATSARRHPGSVGFDDMREKLNEDGPPWLMLLGTGSGLTDEVLGRCEAVLEPIAGLSDYNHLSVRSALPRRFLKRGS